MVVQQQTDHDEPMCSHQIEPQMADEPLAMTLTHKPQSLSCDRDGTNDVDHHLHRSTTDSPSMSTSSSRQRPSIHRSWLPRRTSICSILLLLLSSTLPADGESKVTVVLTQNGLDEISTFATQRVNAIIDTTPIQVRMLTADTAQFGALGHVDMANLVDVGNVALNLNGERLNVVVSNFSLHSRTNISASLWPLPVSDETLVVDFAIRKAVIAIAIGDDHRLTMARCAFDSPTVKSRTTNYWLYSQGAKAGGYYVGKNFAAYACPTVAGIIDALNVKLNATIKLSDVIAAGAAPLPFGLSDMRLHYHPTGMTIKDGVLAAGFAVEWLPASASEARVRAAMNSRPSADDRRQLTLSIEERNGHHLTIWLPDSIVNELFDTIAWDDHLLLNQTVPVTSAMIPERSRTFLTTMCVECYFLLNVYSYVAPHVEAVNDSVFFTIEERVVMDMVNPTRDTSTIFMEFYLGIDGQMMTTIADGRLRVKVDLIDVRTNMTNSAFPPEWSFFVNDLVEGMIEGMIWPQIKQTIEAATLHEGIALSPRCGIDVTTATIVASKQRIGLSVDLQLERFLESGCLADIEAAAPKIDASKLG